MDPLIDGRAWARLLTAGSLVLGLLFMSSPANAIDIPFDPTPIPGEDACNNLDAPIPASPHGFGSFIINPGVDPAGRSPDPFAAEHPASLESVYGTSPQWFTFDNGCTGQFMAGTGTALGNIMLELGGILPNWSHVLLNSVLSPGSWLVALEEPVLEATGATVQGVWSPWLPVVVLIVAALIFLRARSGRLAQSASAAAWALLVLGVSSMAINYPVEIVHMVGDGVRNITGLIATGFNDGNTIPEDPKDLGGEAAVVAIDAQFDEVIRTTQYRTWVIGVFGSPDSETAIDYGPEVFAATHFTWEEYAAYREDPEDAGAKIVEKKADAFKTSAEQIKETDPLAYEYFTGEHWSQRLTTSLINLAILIVTCGFLLFASLATLLAYALIRLIVPFAPVMGVLFMIDRTRDAAVSMLKYIVGPLITGPLCFLAALVLLRFFSDILSAETMWFVLKLGLIAVLTYLAWNLVRPQAYTVAPLLTRTLAPLQHALASRFGTHSGATQTVGYELPAGPDASTRPGVVYMPPAAVRYTNPEAVDFVAYTPPPREIEPSKPTSLALSSANPDHKRLLAQPPPATEVTVDGRFVYLTDDRGRVVKARANLTTYNPDHPRDAEAQATLLGKLTDDHAGHLFARIFEGPGDAINLTPMHGRSVNLSAYKVIENAWKSAIIEGKDVRADVTLDYQGDSRRPAGFDVHWWVDGEHKDRYIPNRSRPKRGDRRGNS